MEMKLLGYFEEYMIEGRFIGCKNCEEQDNREVGFYGKKVQIAECDIVLDNKRKIKKGTEFYTRYYPLHGRVIR